MNKLKGVSLFANVGIAETYLKDTGIDILVANELLEERAKFYSHLYPDSEMIIGDITKDDTYNTVISKCREKNVDFLIATPPCQGMSLAGKMDNFDPRNSLIYYAVKVIKDILPKYILIENVPQQLKTTIRYNEELIPIPEYLRKELGDIYNFATNSLICAKDFDVPQMRKRNITLLSRKDMSYIWELPSIPHKEITLKDAIGDLPSLDPLLREGLEETIKLFPDYEKKRQAGLAISKWHFPPTHAKKHVVTANKAVVAAYFEEFIAAAKANGVKFMVEATSGGGIPWIKNLQRVGRIDEVTELHGIMNGTSNFILSAMTNEGKDFSDVLKTAQELGYAEADPSADIDGDDVRNKCAISASIAFGCSVDVNSILQSGIRHISKSDIDWCRENGLVCKLFATAKRDGDSFDAVVEPVLLPCDTVEANVPRNYNITCLYGETIGEVKLYGQGAGGFPTGNAIVQDIIDVNCGSAYDISFGKKLNKAEIITGRYYLHIPEGCSDYKAVLGDITEKEIPAENGTVIITKETTPAKIHTFTDNEKSVFVARFA